MKSQVEAIHRLVFAVVLLPATPDQLPLNGRTSQNAFEFA